MENVTTMKVSDYINEMKQADKQFAHKMKHQNRKLAYAVLVKQLRLSLRLTQLKFANLDDKPQSMIARIENGNANPTFETLKSIAEHSGKKLVMRFE